MSLNIMVNGLPGAVAQEVVAECLRRGWNVVPFSLSGPHSTGIFTCHGIDFSLLNPVVRQDALAEIRQAYPTFLSVDYTHPSAVNPNGTFYAQNQLPFVMGTTGGDRDQLYRELEASGVYAVIAPNMSKPIVVLQSMFEQMALRFPDVFEGYSLSVVESHQKTKADTSGTAKAIVKNLAQLGLDASEDKIQMLREDQSQLDFGVPRESLKGHAFHTYQIKSTDGSAELVFQHNICGRRTYAEGTCDALVFLQQQIAQHSAKRVFSMIDILESGALA